MKLWHCSVLQDGGADLPPKVYPNVQAKHEWQAQLIAFIMDGGAGETPDGQSMASTVDLARSYVKAVDINEKKR